MKILTKAFALSALIGLLALPQARAVVIAVDLGTAVPPATLGGYAMFAFEPGVIAGESYTAHEVNGDGSDGWATWGQTYTGAVHVKLGTLPLTLSLTDAQAVYFYMEPNQFSDFTMTAKDSSGASVTTTINGFHGSSGVGFYQTDPLLSLSSISVICSDPTGFAVGEFGVNQGGKISGSIGESVPDSGSTAAFLFLGMLGIVAFRRLGRK